MAHSRYSTKLAIKVVFQPTEHRLSTLFWPKVLTATPIRASILCSISGYFNSLVQDGTELEHIYHHEYKHTINLPLSQYELFRLIFNAIQRYGTRMPGELDISPLSFTEVALLLQDARYLQISELEQRLRHRLETMYPRAIDIRTLLASVPIDDVAVTLLINNLARLYDHYRRHHNEQGKRDVQGLVTRQKNISFQMMFAEAIERRRLRDCRCGLEWCCGLHGCCIHARASDLRVAGDGDDGNDEYVTAQEHRPRSFERPRPVRDHGHDTEHTGQRAGLFFSPHHHRHAHDFAPYEESVRRAANSTHNRYNSHTTTTTTATSSNSASATTTRRRRSTVPTSQASTFVPSRVLPGPDADERIRRRNTHINARTSTSTSTSTTSSTSASTGSSDSYIDSGSTFEKDFRRYARLRKNVHDWRAMSREGRREREGERREKDGGWGWSWSSGWSRDGDGDRDSGRGGKGGRCRGKSIDIDDIGGGLCCTFF